MSVKKEASGRRSVQAEVEVPGTPEEVWQAIASGPGISSWFVPTEFEQQDGKPVAVTISFGPGIRPRAAVTAWDPPRQFVDELPDGVRIIRLPNHRFRAELSEEVKPVRDASGQIDIQVRALGNDHVEVVFADNGCGMSLDVRRRAFDPFFTTRRDQGGTGLGLHIVYSIVTTRLGGRLALDSEPGAGTRIRMILPRSAPLEQAAE